PIYEPVAGEVDVVLEVDRDAESRMAQRHVADERVLDVCELALPRPIFKPRETTVDEEADVADVAHRVIRVADARVVDIANRVRRIEPDKRVAVSENEASRHVCCAAILRR